MFLHHVCIQTVEVFFSIFIVESVVVLDDFGVYPVDFNHMPAKVVMIPQGLALHFHDLMPHDLILYVAAFTGHAEVTLVPT